MPSTLELRAAITDCRARGGSDAVTERADADGGVRKALGVLFEGVMTHGCVVWACGIGVQRQGTSGRVAVAVVVQQCLKTDGGVPCSSSIVEERSPSYGGVAVAIIEKSAPVPSAVLPVPVALE